MQFRAVRADERRRNRYETTMPLQRNAAISNGTDGANPAGVLIADSLPDQAAMQAIAKDAGYATFGFAAPAGQGCRARSLAASGRKLRQDVCKCDRCCRLRRHGPMKTPQRGKTVHQRPDHHFICQRVAGGGFKQGAGFDQNAK